MAKLTTRTLSTTTVSSDNIPKNAGLTHQEMDSNFLNLNTDKLENTTDDFTGTLSIKGSGGSAVGIVQLYDNDDSNYLQIKAPATIGTNYTLTMPDTDGGSGQVLTTDGSGVLTWTDKTALSSLNIDGFTDGTGITVAATDNLLISDGGTEKRINASQLLDYVETGITMTGGLTSTAGATALGATTMSGQLNMAAQEITADDLLTAPDVAHENDITSVSQNGTMLRINASDNDTSNTTQAGLFFDQASGRMNYQIVQDLTGAHSKQAGGSGIIHPSLSFQTRDDGGGSTRAAMDLMAPYRGDTGATLTSSSGATGKICDINTSKRIVYLQYTTGTWAASQTTAAGQPVEGTIDAVVSIGTDAVALQYNSSGFTNNETEGDLATLGKVRISTKDVMNGRGIRAISPRMDVEAGDMVFKPNVPTGNSGPGRQYGWNDHSNFAGTGATGGAAHIKNVLSVDATSDDPTINLLFNEGIQISSSSAGDGAAADFSWPTLAFQCDDKHGTLTSPNTNRNTQDQAYGNVWFVKQNKDTANTSQAAVESNQILGGFFGAGSHDSNSLAPTSAAMFMRATEDFTTSVNGTRMEFSATANGDNSTTPCLDITGDSVVVNPDTQDVDFQVHGGSNDNILKVDCGKEIVSTNGVFQVYSASSDPSSNLAEGQMYFNSSTKKFMGYNGTAWVVIGTQS